MTAIEKKDDIQGDIVHEYDGILEADNRLPNWWLAVLFGTILWGGGYWFYYEMFGIGLGPQEEYAAEMSRRAASGGPVTDETLNAIVHDSTMVAAGRAKFEQNCVACHLATGGGSIGPNLTDSAWIHGSLPTNIYQVVKEGVGAKGMPAWGPVLGEGGLQQVVAYVLTLRDTNVAGGKAPEGTVDGAPAPAAAAPAPSAAEAAPEGTVDGAPAAPAAAPSTAEAAPAAPAQAQ